MDHIIFLVIGPFIIMVFCFGLYEIKYLVDAFRNKAMSFTVNFQSVQIGFFQNLVFCSN